MQNVIQNIKTSGLHHVDFYRMICQKMDKATNLFDYIQLVKLTDTFLNRIVELCEVDLLSNIIGADYLFKINNKMDSLLKNINKTIQN